MPIKLSVVIITFNEERNIGRCLASVKEVADEIVVVDSYSTDKTPEICQAFGVRFIQHSFEGHIQQKNFAITQATYPHILSLDADEALDNLLLKSVNQIKVNWPADGYEINRLTNYCGSWIRYGGWYPDRKLRLWDGRKGKWVGTNPHDKFEMEAGSKILKLKGDILHYSYYSIEEHLKQINYFTTIACHELKLKGKSFGLWPLLVKPPFKFFQMYLLKFGWRDGFAGFCVAVLSAYAVFAKYAKLYLANR